MDERPERLGPVQLRQTIVGPMSTNVYLLTDPHARRQLLVDPGADPDAVLTLIGSGLPRATLEVVVVTHRHLDHLDALAQVVAATHATVVAGADDADAITEITGVRVQVMARHGDRIAFGGVQAEVIGLRGHTPGSIALAVPETLRHGGVRTHLFSGDALFPGGLGSTGGDPARLSQLHTDVMVRLFNRFDDDTTVRPGHGPATTLGAERPYLRHWRQLGW